MHLINLLPKKNIDTFHSNGVLEDFHIGDRLLDANAKKILEKRYLQKNKDGILIETPDQLFWRVAKHIASGSYNYKSSDKEVYSLAYKFYKVMALGEFLPNSPTLVNAGIFDDQGRSKGCLSACFTRSPEDTLPSIMEVAYDAAMIEKWGGGIGFGLSKIRPKDDNISTTHGKALGVLNVMDIYSNNAKKITQGSFRLGAHMAQLRDSHPEVFDFIHAKDNHSFSNFNISVQVTDAFLSQVVSDGEWSLINPRDNQVVKTVRARQLFNELCESAWKTGDPGVVFIDRVWETAPNPQLGKIQTSNPCGEENLEDGGSCNLGSIDLSKFVTDHQFDYTRLESVVRIGVLFLDNVIEVNSFPLEILREMNLKTRRIGLGVMGWADALVLLGIPYDSEQAINMAKEVGMFIKQTAWDESAKLAIERGPYPEFDRSALKEWGFPPVRHSSVITCAPTGTISRIAGCSSGIEPHFALAWYSNVLWEDHDGTATQLIDCPRIVRNTISSVTENIKDILKLLINNPIDASSILTRYGLDPSLFKISSEISPESHVRMQAAWQENTTNAVSKTINLPEIATVDDVKEVYLLAWKLKCKGITIYRSGSREIEVLTNKERNDIINKVSANNCQDTFIRPKVLKGDTIKLNTGHGSLYTTLNRNNNNDVVEIFTTIGKSGGCHGAYLEAISRLVSVSLQNGVPIALIIKQLENIVCCSVWSDGIQIMSPADGIAKILRGSLNDMNITPTDTSILSNNKCIDCGSNTIKSEGCISCILCGWSKCA